MKTFAAFLRDERGSAIMEFCLWLPLFMFFLAAIVDASVIYLTHTSMWSAARDTARRVTTGQINPNDYDAIGTHVMNELRVSSVGKETNTMDYYVDPNYDSEARVISIRIGTLIGEASVFGIFGLFAGSEGMLTRSIESTVVMKMEPN